MGANTVDVTEDSFETEVLGSDTPVLVDFWATWCGPCTTVAPILEEIAGEYAGTLTVAKVDVDAHPAVAQRYRVQSIPTMVVFKAGEPVTTIVGAKSKAALLADLADHLG